MTSIGPTWLCLCEKKIAYIENQDCEKTHEKILRRKMICLISAIIIKFRSSRPEVFPKKVALKSIAKLTGNHLCQSFFFNKVAGLRPTTLSKKRLWHRCFLVNFAKFLRAPFFIEHLWLLLLKFDICKQPLCHTV